MNIDTKKARLDAHRPLPSHTAASLRGRLLLEWTYHSNAIEGNTLTLQETKVVLEGITVGGKSMREHLEAINHREAILAVEDLVQRPQPFSEFQIRSLQALVLKGINDANAGIFRKENVVISGATLIPPDHLQVPEQMEELVRWYTGAGDLHPVMRSAKLHSEFVRIHPFVDGNGRTGRLLMNLDLLRAGYPPAIISREERLSYYQALDRAHTTGDLTFLETLVEQCVEASLDLYLQVLESPKIVTDKPQ